MTAPGTFDDRWYVTGAVGYNWQDSKRATKDIPFVTLGFGRFLNRNWSLDGELNYQIHPTFEGRANIVNPDPTLSGEDLNFDQYGISLDLRRHFIAEGRAWNPYILMGLGTSSPRRSTTTSRTGFPAAEQRRQRRRQARSWYPG